MEKRMVRAPDGHVWQVKRRWAPRLGDESLFGRTWRKIKGAVRRVGNVADVADPGCIGLDDLAALVIIILIALFLVFVVVPVIVAIVDLVIVLLLIGLGLVGRVVFRRPWTIEARRDDGQKLRWKAVGWKVSEARRDEIAELLAAGVRPPTEDADATAAER